MTVEIQLVVKVIAGTALAIALIIGFLERWYKPDYYVTSQSKEIPAWIGWLGWGLATAATIVYIFVDFIQWRA